jgi:hypothetical protein
MSKLDHSYSWPCCFFVLCLLRNAYRPFILSGRRSQELRLQGKRGRKHLFFMLTGSIFFIVGLLLWLINEFYAPLKIFRFPWCGSPEASPLSSWVYTMLALSGFPVSRRLPRIHSCGTAALSISCTVENSPPYARFLPGQISALPVRPIDKAEVVMVTHAWMYSSLMLGALFCGLVMRAFSLWRKDSCEADRSCPSVAVAALYLALSILGLSSSRSFFRALAIKDTKEAYAHLWRTGHNAGLMLGVVYVTYIALRVTTEERYMARFSAVTAGALILLALLPVLYVALTSTVLRERLLLRLHVSEVRPEPEPAAPLEQAVEEQTVPMEHGEMVDLCAITRAPEELLPALQEASPCPPKDAASCSSDDNETVAELEGFDLNHTSIAIYATSYAVLPEYKNERLASSSLEYLGSPSQRHPYLLRVASGLLVDANGALLNPCSQPQEALFVICMDGEMLVSFDLNKHHHSSLAAGGAVAAAGMMRIANGRILSIDNLSGHYRPDSSSLRVVMDHLKRVGVPSEDVEWHAYAKSLDASDAAPLPCFTKDSMVNIVRPAAVQMAYKYPGSNVHSFVLA